MNDQSDSTTSNREQPDFEKVADDEDLVRRTVDAYYDDGVLTSAAFSPRRDEKYLSVDRARWRSAEASVAAAKVERPDLRFGAVLVLTAGVRAAELDVKPEPEILNTAHAGIHGQITKSRRKELSRLARLAFLPGER